tara:strand:- start:331006 stop:331479 length:474 start_codon:yes stop_codon:yes gene_type:complete
MNLEIERKFLLNSDEFKNECYQKLIIKQGFLNSDKQRTVRVRISDNKSYITVKGPSNETGTSRFEWEKEISVNEGQQLLELCEEGLIEKVRYLVKCKNHIFEVDEFLGANEGLYIAEIELSNENESFDRPDWLGIEVTGDAKYYNSNLSKAPFRDWQ